ncbi:MAG: thiolase family protein [Dehalococcoidia bacterium]|nr:thiolase family protein [Dehalococcoidia bacterium]
MAMEWPKGKRPVFVGAGFTSIRRYMPRSISQNAKAAATMAITDAGLQVADIDGMFIWADPNWGPSVVGDPKVWLDVNHLMQVMPWGNIKFWLQPEAVAAGSCSGIQAAALALGAGACNYAIVVRTGHHPAGVRYRQISARTAAGSSAFTQIYGHGVGGANQSVSYQAYLAKYGARREEMAGYVLTAHDNAQDSPPAVWRGREITLDDYLNARLIAYPMNIFDNDMPCDGVLAVVMTTEDRAKDTPHPGGYISGMAAIPWHTRSNNSYGAESLEQLEEMGALMGSNLYANAGVGPEDIDLKHVYDGFSPMVWQWIEAFGFAPRGEAHAWAQPETIGRHGPHPLNTSGGNLGNGRIHGFSHVLETAQQMMGTAGTRQIASVDAALCETGPFGNGSAFICTRE